MVLQQGLVQAFEQDELKWLQEPLCL